MTVEHDGPGGYDRDDPLMAVLTGDPLPHDARTDPALLAAYRSAEADVALLREQLGIIAHALTEPEPQPETETEPEPEPEPGPASRAPARPEPVPVPSPRPSRQPSRQPSRRTLRWVRNGLGLAAALAVFLGTGWLAVQAGQGVDDAASGAADKGAESAQKSLGPLGSPAYLACTRLLVEGTVTDVVPGPRGGEERVTVDVIRSYRPAGATGGEATFVTGDAPAFGAPRSLREGDHVLVAVPRRGEAADLWFVGEEDIAPQRRAIAEALPRARSTTCP
ncbi:hypothetical protein AB0K92_23000 [Streptomyces sp. NPDC052687]|uniref:hypothetical protein n=1 Tax=Streptomyces sp. NPDC052687 TaxID=3154759 RepID=UPI003415C327